jgi:hypothetical protein
VATWDVSLGANFVPPAGLEKVGLEKVGLEKVGLEKVSGAGKGVRGWKRCQDRMALSSA